MIFSDSSARIQRTRLLHDERMEKLISHEKEGKADVVMINAYAPTMMKAKNQLQATRARSSDNVI